MMASGSRNSHALRRSAPTNRFEPAQTSRGKNTKNRKSENQTLPAWSSRRSEEHTSELQSTNAHLVCRLLLEKKNTIDLHISSLSTTNLHKRHTIIHTMKVNT